MIRKDCYQCPAGRELTYRFDIFDLGRHIRYYMTTACRVCQIKRQCTRKKEGRRITCWVHESIMALMGRKTDKVDYWENSNQKQRWFPTGLLDIEPRLNKINGYRHLPELRRAIQGTLEIKVNEQIAA